MKITAESVKELREKTGSGMMECKNALVETKGDIEQAIILMRKKGQAKASKKGVRIASEGLINILSFDKEAIILEINCETDFVARGDIFKNFSEELLNILQEVKDLSSVEELLNYKFNGEQSVDEKRKALIAKIGENITIRRFTRLNVSDDGGIGQYLHGLRIGVVVKLNKKNVDLAKDIAMHIAASNPEVIKAKDYSEHKLSCEREIYQAKLKDSGKPEAIQNKIVNGQIDKFLKQVTLEGQPFIKDSSKTVGQLLQENDIMVIEFVRYELGEGLEKKVVDFASEVQEQIKGI